MKTQHNQNVWDATKAVQNGKCTIVNGYIKKEKKSQINLTLHLMRTQKEQFNPKLE